MKQKLIDSLIQLALKEDIGDGDHTTLSTISPLLKGRMQLITKEDGILAGIEIVKQIFYTFDPNLDLSICIIDGNEIKKNDVIFIVKGKIQSLLQVERLVLNIMQRMSGIATVTRKYVKKLEGTVARILDTRKTTPGMRMIEKEAVSIGGGENHRVGLFDMILLKDNHIDFVGGIKNAIFSAKKYINKKKIKLPIEIEVRTLNELNKVLQIGGINRIMLDNFSVENTYKAVKLVDGRYKLESSGGITYDNIRSYAETGVNYISVGALTHSVKSLDMSLKIINGD